LHSGFPLGLKWALIPQNIKNGFKNIGIFPLNANAMDGHFGPNAVYEHAGTRDGVGSIWRREEASNQVHAHGPSEFQGL
jgi:hypothetical protein